MHVDRCDVSDLEDVRRFAAGLDVDRLDVLVHNAGAMPATRTESAQGHELTMALHLLGSGADDRAARSRAGRPRRPDDLRDLGRDVRPARCAPTTRSTVAATTRRPRPTPAASGPRSSCCPLLARRWAGSGIGVHATHPGLGRHSRAWRSRCPGSTSSPARCSATPRAAPTPPSGWRPPRRSRARASCGTTAAAAPTHLLRRTRTGEADRAAMWDWVRQQTGLGRDDADRLLVWTGRNETEVERADRNWLELIQELRVAQTGIQVLAGLPADPPVQLALRRHQ